MCKLAKALAIILMVTAPALLGGCADGSPPPSPGPQTASLAPTPTVYQLSAGDQIDVTVFGEDNLSGTYDLDDSGSFSMPLVGPISVKDKTARQAEEIITARLADGLVADPKVSINIKRTRPIYVLGEVQKPGAYPSYGPTTLLNAIALAGGFTYRARTTEVTVIRYNDPSHAQAPVTDMSIIQPGDTVTVPERWF